MSLTDMVIMPGADYQDACEAIREKTGGTGYIRSGEMGGMIRSIVNGGGSGKRTCRFTIGTSTNGWTESDCDYLCDGTADEVEINAAIQALPVNGGEIVILDGTYNLDASILANKANVVIRGNGMSTTLAGNIQPAEDEGLITVTADDVSVCNMQIIDNIRTPYNGVVLCSVLALGCKRTTIYMCRVTLYTHIKIGEGCSFAEISSCVRDDGFDGGKFIAVESASDCLLSGNKATYGTIELTKASNSQLFNNKIFNSEIILSESSKNVINANYIGAGINHNLQISKGYNNVCCQNAIDASVDCYGVFLSNGGSNLVNDNNINMGEAAIGIRCVKENGDSIQNNIVNMGSVFESDPDYYHSIRLNGTGNNNMFVANNLIMGKDVTSGGGTGNTIINNKWAATMEQGGST